MARVFSASSVSSFSSCCVVAAGSMPSLRSLSSATCRSSASRCSTQRAQRRVGVGHLGRPRPLRRQEQRRRQLALGAVVERGVLGEDVAALLVGRLDLGLGVVERFEHRHAAVAVAIGAVALQRFDEERRRSAVSLRSPPVLVAVTIVRPGPASTDRNAPLELAVLTKTTRCSLKLVEQRLVVVRRQVGARQVERRLRPSKLPWPMSSTKTSSLALARAAMSANALATFSRVERPLHPRGVELGLLAEVGDVGVGDAVLLRRVDDAAAHLWNCVECSS